MIVSVTGASGFIGIELIKRLIKLGFHIKVLSRKNHSHIPHVETFLADLTDPTSNFDNFLDGADVLYNCAGEVNDESLMRKLHVDGTKLLLKQAKGRVGRWVQLSSVGGYGACRRGIVTEESPERPLGVYEQTKTEADAIVKRSGIPYVILRPSNVFGLTMHNQSLFQLVEMIRKGLFFYLGRAGALVNYVHVEDVVEALLNIGSNNRALGNIYNLSQTTEVEQMVKSFLSGLDIERQPFRLPEWPIRKLAQVVGRIPGSPLTVPRIDALTGSCQYDSNKIREELCFEFISTLESRFSQFALDQV